MHQDKAVAPVTPASAPSAVAVLERVPSPRAHADGGRPDPGVPALIDRDELLAELDRALPATSPVALVQFGMDNFRHLNAGVGPGGGDVALARTGRVLAREFAPHHVARVGGDCFSVLVPYAGRPAAQAQLDRALSLVAAADLSDDGTGVRATASAGLTVLDRPALTPRGAMQEADLAMAEAKHAGRNRAAVHHADQAASATSAHTWAAGIRHALETDAFVLHAQPVVGLRARVDQWELLVRLPDDSGELLPPRKFLPIAEQFGLMQRVDEWVTRRAAHMIAAAAALGRVVRLEVNIGQSTLASPSFVETVEELLRTTGIDPSCLIFEVNGTTAAANLPDVTVFSERLHELGCLFALDGFGRNSGALEQLKVLPLDFVKLDGFFVRHLPSSRADQHIVEGLIRIAHDLGCQVIAMSVSDDESRALLDGFGADYVQGFHIGRPQPLVDPS